MPMNTSMSAWLVIMSLIFFDSCDRILVVVGLAGAAVVAPGFGIHVTVGLKAWVLPVVLAPISDFPGAFEPR